MFDIRSDSVYREYMLPAPRPEPADEAGVRDVSDYFASRAAALAARAARRTRSSWESRSRDGQRGRQRPGDRQQQPPPQPSAYYLRIQQRLQAEGRHAASGGAGGLGLALEGGAAGQQSDEWVQWRRSVYERVCARAGQRAVRGERGVVVA